jgi:hypothetical protein
MDSTTISISSSPRPHSIRAYRSHIGASSGRGDQPPGWNGLMASFQDSTRSKRPRSRSKPGMVSREGVVSGFAALLLTSSSLRSEEAKCPASRAAARVAAP